MHVHTNRLASESSPYLLQHAHNPVDWYPWGEEAFEKARRENKPVLVSIGYAACHWCHVMERESFENEEVAALMNEHLVSIKVDREERPDVDHLYMDAVQAISGTGGWPLNVFLTPEGKPFYGGTYFPPKRAFNRASWTEVVQAVVKSYHEKKDEIEDKAQQLTAHLTQSNTFGQGSSDFDFSRAQTDKAFQNSMRTADKTWGGFGRAPKFPQTFVITFLLRYAHLTKNEEAKEQALLSLDKMMQGGLYDHVGGGFARYSTDAEWLVPHFEKMLYDNALLVMALAEAYQLTGEERFREVLEETLQFVERELMHPEGGFFSALDADSEGEEGKFYVWDEEEVKSVLGADFEWAGRYFNLRPEGNWEGKNILHTTLPPEEFVRQHGLNATAFRSAVRAAKEKLLQARGKRVRPLLDDKVLLNWNALMNGAYTKAYAATGNEAYLQTAGTNMRFLLRAFEKDGSWFHSWKNGLARHPAFLDDFALLIAALIDLAQATSDFSWLHKAKHLAGYVQEHFRDEASSFFFYTSDLQTDILLRKKELYDGATPSGNSLMAANLYRLSILFDQEDWQQQAGAMLASFGDVITKYPTSFGYWLLVLTEWIWGTDEIAVLGADYAQSLPRILQMYTPHRLVMGSATERTDYPLLNGKPAAENLIYLCRNYACQRPVSSVEELKKMLA